ncbi:Terminase DNA packaging enzyme [compost metagenome]
MNDRQQTRFEERLSQIIGAEDDISKAIDGLENSNGEPSHTNLPTVVTYDDVPSKMEESEALPADLLDDYKYSRKILHGLIERGIVALEGASIVARESEHPKAFEVVATLMNNISHMTKDLLDLQKPLKAGAGPAGKQTIAKQVNIQINGAPVENGVKEINALLDDL